MNSLTDSPGAALADQLLKQSESDARATAMDAVLGAARRGAFTDEKFAQAIPDESLRALFQSQTAELRSHVLMGRFQTERFIQKEIDAELARRLSVIDDDLVRHQLRSQQAEELMHFMEGKYQIDAYALTPAEQKQIEDVFDFLLRPWASEPSRALGGSA